MLMGVCVQVRTGLDPLATGFLHHGQQQVDVFGRRRSLHPGTLPHPQLCTQEATAVSLTRFFSADFISELLPEANAEEPDLFQP